MKQKTTNEKGYIMAQVKVYGLRSNLDANKQAISDSIHGAVVSALSYRREKRFHRFFPLDQRDFLYPDDRSENYINIEISMFEGRGGMPNGLRRQRIRNIQFRKLESE